MIEDKETKKIYYNSFMFIIILIYVAKLFIKLNSLYKISY
jgi:hypothetical protein